MKEPSKITRLQKTWDSLGRKDPLWAVLTHQGKMGGRWDLKEFFATGRREIASVLARAKKLGLRVKRGRALDFGCAVGRLTQALCRHFRFCLGVDIAPAMITRARAFNRFGPRCRYQVNASPRLEGLKDDSFDFVYCSLVLQHMPPELAKGYIAEFLRVLKKGGLAVFQVPEKPFYPWWRLFAKKIAPRYLIHAYRRLRYGKNFNVEIEVEMNGIAKAEVQALVEANQGRLEHAQNQIYWVLKKGRGRF